MAARRNWLHAAGVIWPMLTKAAASGRTLTYTEVAPVIAPNPLSVGHALGPIQTYCMENRLAPLTVVVVGLNSGVPGNGFVAWDVDDLRAATAAVRDQNWVLVGNPFACFGPDDTDNSFANKLVDDPDASAELYRLVRDRGIAQGIFRRALLIAYGSRCALCGLGFPDALEAAHIVTCSECGPDMRLDLRNGILLCASHHRRFDRDLIKIRADLSIRYYDPQGREGHYRKVDSAFSLSLHGATIRLPDQRIHRPAPAYVERRNILSKQNPKRKAPARPS